ncbi:MAG: AraC family transcriptional regulator [Gammaproteobacteria bacterium]|nr:AraC family transcriptional regulator [Gammaproteobacteria bacterium]
MRGTFSGLLLMLLAFAPPLSAQPSQPVEGLDRNIETLKQEVLELNRDLFLLEEELLYPSSTQLAVFVSMDVGAFFELDSVQLKIDDKEVASYLYTDRQVDALHRGGVHRLYTGNVRVGEHEVVAFFTGKGPNGRDYRRGATRVIVKDVGPRFVELRIEDRTSKLQPEFSIREW